MRDVSLDSLDATRMRLFRTFLRVRLASSVGPLKIPETRVCPEGVLRAKRVRTMSDRKGPGALIYSRPPQYW